jgi:hypothetical protein
VRGIGVIVRAACLVVFGAIALVAMAPAAGATTTIANTTITDLRLPAGAHDLIYDHVTFVGTDPTRAVLQIDTAAHRITFRYCTITSGPWNGITINDSLGNIHDITFAHCHILTQGRMGLECTSRPISTTKGYRRIQVLHCVFEPQGSEGVSFDGGTACAYNRVSHTVIKGAGVNPNQQWGAGFECNGPSKFRFTYNRVYQCRGPLLNLQRHVRSRSGWVFRHNVLNASRHVQTVAMKNTAQVVCGINVYGGRFGRNLVRSAAPGGGVAWFGNCHKMNWRTTKWRDVRGGSYRRPTAQYGSSGNRF